MRTLLFYVLTTALMVLSYVSSVPVQFEDEHRIQESDQAVNPHEESRRFHGHAMRKRKKKKLLHCLLSLQRSNPQVDARTLFFNYVNLEYTQHGGGNGGYNDDSGGGGGYQNCLSQLGGGSHGGGSQGGGDGDDGGSTGLGGIGEGINNLGSLVSQVPSNLISSVGDGIRPVFENPERYLNRYIIRPLYRSLRPLYRLF
ncbi:glycine-rich RNA-binding protein 8-like [Homalodisca vitripennis]|uniref:glycine-rich RNA-binding protein 8-like n=1 Tax=Homalodisca vitripennis TaxID=197043 RepID=UPI001EEBF22C|nr:glycine-rich RNA-binding protein 8-like [Homalodisca vitripennis]